MLAIQHAKQRFRIDECRFLVYWRRFASKCPILRKHHSFQAQRLRWEQSQSGTFPISCVHNVEILYRGTDRSLCGVVRPTNEFMEEAHPLDCNVIRPGSVSYHGSRETLLRLRTSDARTVLTCGIKILFRATCLLGTKKGRLQLTVSLPASDQVFLPLGWGRHCNDGTKLKISGFSNVTTGWEGRGISTNLPVRGADSKPVRRK
jgi:hypothetical protein